MEPMTIERRAAVHAALADPARVGIVDELWCSDRSPAELGRAVGAASNLLAHHLDVLDAAGLVQRSRSHGDGRRRYVRLRHEVLGALWPEPRLRARRALFVCTHNSARSQLAAALWTSITGAAASSAGTHPAASVHPGAVAAAGRAGLDLSNARPHELRTPVAAPLVVTVCDRAHEEVGLDEAWLHWSLPDPAQDGRRADFDAVVVELRGRISALTGQGATP